MNIRIANESENDLYVGVKSVAGTILLEETHIDPWESIPVDTRQENLICVTLHPTAGSGAEDYVPRLKLEKTLSRIFSTLSAYYRLAAVTEYTLDLAVTGDRVAIQSGKSDVTDSCYVMWMQPPAFGIPAGALSHCIVPGSASVGEVYRRDTRSLRRRTLIIALLLEGVFGFLIVAAAFIILGACSGVIGAREVLIAVAVALVICTLAMMDYYISVGRSPIKKMCSGKRLRKIIGGRM